MSLSVRVKTIWVLLLSGVSIYLGVSNLADRVAWRQVDDGVEWVQTKRGAEVRAFDGEVAGGGNSPRPGDLLLSVQDIPVGSVDVLTDVREVLARTWPSEVPIEYVLQRGEAESVTVSLRLRRESGVQPGDVALAVVAFGYLLIGLFIFLRHLNASGAFHFFLLCLVAFILLLYRHSGRADAFDLTIYWCNTVALFLLPPLFLHFSLCFPRPADWVARHFWRKAALYLPGAALAIFHAAWFAGWLQPVGLARNEAVRDFLDRVYLAHVLLLFAVGGLALLRVLRDRAASAVQRHQMKWVAYGTLAGLAPFAGLYAVPYLLGWPVRAAEEISVLSLILVPLSFGYAITRYRLMDIDLIFKKSAAYLLASGALLGVYVLIVIFVGQALHSLWGGWQPLLLALGALLVAFTFAPLKDRIQELIDRSFYKDRYGYRQSYADFGRALNAEVSLSEIVGKTSDRLRKTLDLRTAAVFLREDPSRPVYQLYGADEADCRVEIGDEDLERLCEESGDLFPEMFSRDLATVRAKLEELELRYFQPLWVHDRLIGFLGLGRRADGRLLSSEDLQLVAALAAYAAIAIDNALLYRSLEANAAELSELKAYNENVVESIATGVVVASAEGEITTWNSTMETLYGLPRGEALGKHLRDVFPESLISSLQPFLNGPRWDLAETGRLHKTYLKTREGQEKMVHITLAPFVSTSNLNAGTLLAFDDITEKARLENQLMQAEKLSSIGLFAAGIAHEVNTPLAGISSYVQMLIKDTPEDDARRDVLRRIEQQTFRASEIINNLLNFARVSESDVSEVNLNSLVVETVSLLDHPMRKSRVEVEMDLDASLPSTLGNGGKLQQVFMNLFLNARDAMPEGGRLRIRTRSRDSALVVEVADTGQGISRENIKKIYDPFFTTKEVGKGTGLGLSVSYGIIQEHSGRISVDSRPGRGTVFTLELPVKRVH